MTRHNKRLAALLLALLMALTACGAPPIEETPAETIQTQSVTPLPQSALAVQTEPAAQTGTRIQLNGNSATIEGKGASVKGSVVTINRSGVYTLSGSLSNGQIIVDAAGSATSVQLILAGVDIACSNSAPIWSKQAGETIVTLAEGSVNTLKDDTAYTTADEPDAALFAKDNLRINGTGSLNVTARFENGIGSKDNLVIESGVISVTAENHGLRGTDSLSVTGGDITVNCVQDAVHSNGDVAISGGSFTISCEDDGVHADGTASISGGNINILTSYEGIEGAVVSISGGTIRLKAEDDGINAAGGTDSIDGEQAGPFGGDTFRRSDDWRIDISGGDIYVDSGVDGLDSNGNIFMKGGNLTVEGSPNGMSAPIDFDNGVFELSGGTIVAAGSSGMAQSPTQDSSQPALMVYFSSTQPAKTAVQLVDESGKAIVTYKTEKSFECILLSAPAIVSGGRYTVLVDGEKRFTVTLSGATTYVDETGQPVSGGMRSFGGMRGGRQGGRQGGGIFR